MALFSHPSSPFAARPPSPPPRPARSSAKGGLVRLALGAWLLSLTVWPLTPGPALAQTGPAAPPAGPILVVTPALEKVALGPFVEWLEDPTRGLALEEVASPALAARFNPNHNGALNFGMSRSAFWLRFRVQNQSGQSHFALNIDFAPLNRLELYEPGPNGYTRYLGGNAIPLAQRSQEQHDHVFQLELPPGQSRTYYLKAVSDSALLIPISWMSQEELVRHLSAELLLYGLYFGLVVVMALYNLFIYYTLRERRYLYYVGFAACFGLWIFLLNGFGSLYLFQSPALIQRLIPISVMAALLFALLFTRQFLETPRQSPRLDRLALRPTALALGMLIPTGGVMDLFQYVQVANLTGALVILLLLFTGTASLRQGGRQARFYVAAWAMLMIGSLAFALASMGMLPTNLFTLDAIQWGSALEVVLFSLALADRVRQTHLQKEAALIQFLENSKENQLLRQEIGKREQAELEMRAAKEAAEEATRLKDNFVSLIAHDVRAPISAIMSMAEGLNSDPDHPLGEGQQGLIRAIQQRGKSFLRLTDNLLSLNRIQTGKLKPVVAPCDAWTLAEEAAIMVSHLAREKEVKIINNLPPGTQFQADPTLLAQVLQNLFSNAVKFSHAQGKVEINLERQNSSFVLSVRDYGTGIPPHLLEQIFSATEPTSTPGTHGEPGSGVGLPLSRQIVLAHGGRLWAQSKPGEGSVFSVSLPQAKK